MIFVTVGLEGFQFDRLIKSVDSLIMKNIIKEETFMQIGTSEYEPINCSWERTIEFDSFIAKLLRARIVITHAGIGSIILCIQNDKIPIVLPRQKCFGEIVDNHQLEFIKEFDKSNTIITVYKTDYLKTCLEQYNKIVAEKELIKGNSEAMIVYLQDLVL